MQNRHPDRQRGGAKFEFYTSRLGIRYNDIINFYKTKIQKNKKFKLKMLHFFINTGIKDTAYYWNELSKCLNIYCELKAFAPIWTASTSEAAFRSKTRSTSRTTTST